MLPEIPYAISFSMGLAGGSVLFLILVIWGAMFWPGASAFK